MLERLKKGQFSEEPRSGFSSIHLFAWRLHLNKYAAGLIVSKPSAI